MNYKQIYDSLIKSTKSKNRSRKDNILYENHHILPRCMNGNNNAENLVLLTPKEHFVAHHLLCKMYNSELLNFAFWSMCNQKSNGRTYKITAVVYARAKEKFSQMQSGRMSGENNPHYKKIWTDEERKIAAERTKLIRKNKKWGLSEEEKQNRVVRMSGENNPNFGKERSIDHIANWKESRTGGAGWVISEERKKLLSVQMSGDGNPMYGKTHSEATKELMRLRAINRPKLTCPHCGKISSKTNSKRWHFDNCHLLLNITE